MKYSENVKGTLKFGVHKFFKRSLCYFVISDVSRTLWVPGVLGKVAPVPAILMLYYANAISGKKISFKILLQCITMDIFLSTNINNLLTK
jgi:hypothetical protein